MCSIIIVSFRKVNTAVTDNGTKYKKLFNQLVAPRTEPLMGKPIIILWSNLAGSLAQKMDYFVPLISRKINKGMKKSKIGQVNSKSSVTIQGVKNKIRLISLYLLNH